ncbi:MAG TPA: hypothetical protein VGE52_01245 [Pirellulales bacterium]
MHHKRSLSAPPNRDQLIAEFWSEVRSRLIKHHHRNPDEADLGIGRYRGTTERRGLRDVIYNQGVEETAETVDDVIKHGLPNPS